MKKDIFKEKLHPIEGVQEFKESKSNLFDKIKGLGKKGKNFCVVKEKRPSWYSEDMKWNQTYSIQRKDKMKQLGIKCESERNLK